MIILSSVPVHGLSRAVSKVYFSTSSILNFCCMIPIFSNAVVQPPCSYANTYVSIVSD